MHPDEFNVRIETRWFDCATQQGVAIYMGGACGDRRSAIRIRPNDSPELVAAKLRRLADMLHDPTTGRCMMMEPCKNST